MRVPVAHPAGRQLARWLHLALVAVAAGCQNCAMLRRHARLGPLMQPSWPSMGPHQDPPHGSHHVPLMGAAHGTLRRDATPPMQLD